MILINKIDIKEVATAKEKKGKKEENKGCPRHEVLHMDLCCTYACIKAAKSVSFWPFWVSVVTLTLIGFDQSEQPGSQPYHTY